MASPVVIVLTFALCFLAADCTPLQKRQASLTDLTAYFKRVETAVFVVYNLYQGGDAASLCNDDNLIEQYDSQNFDGQYAKSLV